MNQPVDMFGMALADIATRVTRQAVQADPVLSARLAQLQGNTVELQCTLPAATWHIHVEGGSLLTQAGPAPAPQAVVRGSLMALGSWLLPGPSLDGVEISGDNTLLLELTDILRDFSPDLAAPLHNLFGNEMANSLLGGAEAGLQALRSLLQSAGQTVQAQATSQFVQQPQLTDFLDGVDQLRLQVDRLAARIAQLESANAGASASQPSGTASGTADEH